MTADPDSMYENEWKKENQVKVKFFFIGPKINLNTHALARFA